MCGWASGELSRCPESRYRRELEVWVLPRGGDLPLKHMMMHTIRRWVVRLCQSDVSRDGEHSWGRLLMPKTVRSVITIVMSFALLSGG